MGQFSYKPQTITADAKFHTTYDGIHQQNIQLYTADQTAARQHLAQLKANEKLGPGTDKGVTKEAAKASAMSAKEANEQAMVHMKQADFHKQRAESHLEMARNAGRYSLQNNSDAAPSSLNPKATAPSMIGGPSTVESAIDFHSQLYGDALQRKAEMLRTKTNAKAPPEDADMDTMKQHHEAMGCLDMMGNHFGEMAQMHREMLGDYNSMLNQRGYDDEPDTCDDYARDPDSNY